MMYSPFASAKPSMYAFPYPSFSGVITFAPSDRAIWDVLSVELSATITSQLSLSVSKISIAFVMHVPIVSSSFMAGIINEIYFSVMLSPLYN